MSHPLYHAITNVSDDLIDEAITTNLHSHFHWYQYTALVACLAVVLSLGSRLVPFDANLKTEAATDSAATAPETAPEAELAPAPQIPAMEQEESTSEDVAILGKEDTQPLTLALVAWQSEGFRGTVIQGDDIFPEGAELTVFFDDNTEITLEDDTYFSYTSADPNAPDISYPEGTTITVSFTNYEEYVPDKGFSNRIYATTVDVN